MGRLRFKRSRIVSRPREMEICKRRVTSGNVGQPRTTSDNVGQLFSPFDFGLRARRARAVASLGRSRRSFAPIFKFPRASSVPIAVSRYRVQTSSSGAEGGWSVSRVLDTIVATCSSVRLPRVSK